MRLEEAEVENRVVTAAGTMATALQEMTPINQLNFIPGFREYKGLERLGTNPNLH